MKRNSDRREGIWWLVAAALSSRPRALGPRRRDRRRACRCAVVDARDHIHPADFIGVGEHPTVTVEAPSPPWHPFKEFGVVSDCCGIGFWDVGMVARNPCHSIGNLVDPGPTVDDLVAALEAQSMRHATKPTDVTLGGYSGKYLEWSMPKHWVVTGDGDFKGCDVQATATATS